MTSGIVCLLIEHKTVCWLYHKDDVISLLENRYSYPPVGWLCISKQICQSDKPRVLVLHYEISDAIVSVVSKPRAPLKFFDNVSGVDAVYLVDMGGVLFCWDTVVAFYYICVLTVLLVWFTQFGAKICLLTSFRDTCFIEILPRNCEPKRGNHNHSVSISYLVISELFLLFWFQQATWIS